MIDSTKNYVCVINFSVCSSLFLGEFDNQGSGDIESTVCARQPRTLSMAIVPGEHIKEIVWARQQNSCLEKEGEESTHEANSPDIDDGHAKDRTDCVSIPP